MSTVELSLHEYKRSSNYVRKIVTSKPPFDADEFQDLLHDVYVYMLADPAKRWDPIPSHVGKVAYFIWLRQREAKRQDVMGLDLTNTGDNRDYEIEYALKECLTKVHKGVGSTAMKMLLTEDGELSERDLRKKRLLLLQAKKAIKGSGV